MEALLNAFRSLGPARILALFIGLSATIMISGMVLNRLNNPGLALLYGGLNAQEASAITQYLGSQNIDFEARGADAVYVPADQVGTLRLQVAGQGLVGGSTSGYELFDNTSAFGTTNFVQNLNAKRALEGELARTIATIPAVSGARVHIVMPKQNLFSSQQVKPSAAVALNVGSRTLEKSQVNSIAQLVAASVPNLSNNNITVIDQRGALLFDGREVDSGTAMATTLRQQVEKQYETSITNMLEKAVGMGKVAVQVSAEVNADQVQESSEIYDPTQQVVRSEQLVEIANTSSDGSSGGAVGVQGNIPGDGAGAGGGNTSSSAENRTETTTNYEIGKTVRQLTRSGGEVERLSVAVLIEGRVNENENGEPVYTPYTPEQMENFRRLVETAIGYDAARGDQVEIADMQFSVPPAADAPDEPFMTKEQILQIVQYILLIVALLVVAILVVKPTINMLMEALATNAPAPAIQRPVAPAIAHEPAEDTGVDIQQVQGRVSESSIKKVNEIVDQHPEESLNVVRGWMAQGGSTADDGDNG